MARLLPGNLLKLMKGYFESKKILKQFNPDVILFTGGYLAVPMAFAASRVKKLLYVPEIEPGLALKTLAGYADMICLTTETSKIYFNARIIRQGRLPGAVGHGLRFLQGIFEKSRPVFFDFRD